MHSLRLRFWLGLVWVAITGLTSNMALATNGYFQHGYGTISKGMAGAGAAWSQDGIAAATNPAGMAFVGDRLDGGLEAFSPHRQYRVSGAPAEAGFGLRPGQFRSSKKGFTIPHLGFNKTLSSGHNLGLSVFANGGMNTTYPGLEGGPFGGGRTGVDLEQLFIAPTWSWEFAPGQALGFSPLLAYQRFSAKGLEVFGRMGFSAAPDALTDQGTDDAWGYGFQVGWQGDLSPHWRAGASWRSILHMDEFSKYKGLFAEQGNFDIPQMFNLGLAYSGFESHRLLLDVQHIRYSAIDSVSNPLLPNLQQARLGDDAGAGFGWDDMTVFKIGWQWQQTERQAWRAGVSYGEQPISDSEVLFNILAPGVQEWHLTTGFTRQLKEGLELSGMLLYSPPNRVSGANPLSPGQTIELRMYQLAVSASVGWSF